MKAINNYISEKLVINKETKSLKLPKIYNIYDQLFINYRELRNHVFMKDEFDDNILSFIHGFLHEDLYPLYYYEFYNNSSSKRYHEIDKALTECRKYFNINFDDTHNNNNISKSLSGKYSTCVLTYYKSQNYIEIFVFTKNYSKTYLIISEISGK